jgi:hypothetical protein
MWSLTALAYISGGAVVTLLVSSALSQWGHVDSISIWHFRLYADGLQPEPRLGWGSDALLRRTRWVLPAALSPVHSDAPPGGHLRVLRYDGTGVIDVFTLYTTWPATNNRDSRWHRSGWPLASFECRATGNGLPLSWNEGWVWKLPAGVEWGPYDRTTHWIGGGRPPIPLRPVFPGLLVDTALFAALLFLAGLVASQVRRARRFGLGRCATCGYSRRGLPSHTSCPECGHLATHQNTDQTAASHQADARL